MIFKREIYITGSGQRLRDLHKRTDDCDHGCPIHNPSADAEAIGATHWRVDRGLMERICHHAVGHPDPDHIRHTARVRGERAAHYESIHGCDGCCAVT